MRGMRIQCSSWFAGMLIGACSGQVLAIGNFKPSPAELAALPAFCAPRAQPWGNQASHPEVRPWASIYGQDWIHMHHYCAGLNFINRSYRGASKSEKDNTLRTAVSEFDYTLKNIRSNTALSAEVLMARGQALLGLGRVPEANRDLDRAVAIDPKLKRAYGLLADSYVALKQKDKALQVISEGIRRNPEATSLKRRYDELGGTKPYPSAYVAETPEKPAAVDTPAATGTQAEAGSAGKIDAPEAPPSAAASPADAPVTPPPIGSPTNPYCRFCP